MGIKNKEEYLERIKHYPIWKLINLTNAVTNRIIQLRRQGSTNKERVLRGLKYKRNVILDLLTEKLLLRKNGKAEELPIFDKMEELIELSL